MCLSSLLIPFSVNPRNNNQMGTREREPFWASSHGSTSRRQQHYCLVRRQQTERFLRSTRFCGLGAGGSPFQVFRLVSSFGTCKRRTAGRTLGCRTAGFQRAIYLRVVLVLKAGYGSWLGRGARSLHYSVIKTVKPSEMIDLVARQTRACVD